MLKAQKWAGKCLQIVEHGILSIGQIGLLSSEAFVYILYSFFFYVSISKKNKPENSTNKYNCVLLNTSLIMTIKAK